MYNVNIVTTCPNCGSTEWIPKKDGEFKCYSCGRICYPEEMSVKTQKLYRELSVSVNGGSLIAHADSDPDYPSVSICYETNEGDLIDVVVAECKRENDNQDIDVYTFDDVYTEDPQRKFTLKKKDIDAAFGGD